MATGILEDNGNAERKPKRMFSPGKRRIVRGKAVSGKGTETREFLAEIIYSNNAKPEERIDLAEAISSGFPTGAISRLIEHLAIPQKEMLDLLHITTSTFNRRREKGKLESIESDRVYRYAKLVGLAKEMFHGDEEAARRWLKSPAYLFRGETPLEHAKTEYGAREVETLIGRIRHGIPS